MNKILLYLISCIIFALGATSFIFSNLGTDPLDVFCIGIQNHIGWKIGTTQSLFAILCLAIWSGINKFKIPPISTFLTFFICGYLIDFFRYFLGFSVSYINPYLFLATGLILCVQGSAGIIMSSFGIRAMDLVALSLAEKTKFSFWLYKGVAEMILLLTGYALGGPVGLGTVMFLLVVGWMIQPVILINEKLGVKNYIKIK